MSAVTLEALLERLDRHPIIAAVRDPVSNRLAIASPVRPYP